MSRESKMALLVGLGFIITFGVILSEARSDKLAGDGGAVALAIDQQVVAPTPRPLSARIPEVHRPEPLFNRPGRQTAGRAPGPAEVAVDEYVRRRSDAIADDAAARDETRQTRRDERRADVAAYLGIYTVQAGDNLTKIARKVYGQAGEKRFLDIYKANTDKLSDPDSVSVGMKLLIPR